MDNVLGEIKKGVEGMISSQKEHEGRIADCESALRQRKALSMGRGVDLPGLEAEKSRFSLAKACAAIGYMATGQSNAWEQLDAGFEKEVLAQTTRKALDSGTGGAGGGYVIPVQYSNEIVQLLRAKARVVQAGATVLEGLIGSPFVVPKQLTAGSSYWIGQNATVTASDATFGQIQMTPKTLAMRAQFSNLLNILANPSMEKLIRDDFAKVGALELDRVALRGLGASNQPLGVNGVTGLQALTIGANGGTFTFDQASQMLMLLDSANALDGKLAFITHPRAAWKMRRERIPQYSGQVTDSGATGGNYVMPPIISQDQLNSMLGCQMLSTTQLPINLAKGTSSDCTEVYCGNWEDLLIGMWGSLEILATNIGGNAWTQNSIEVRLILNMDVQVRHGESFALCNDARTT